MSSTEEEPARPRLDLRLLLPATAAWVGAWIGLDMPVWATAACCALGVLLGACAWRHRRYAAAAALLCLVAGMVLAALRVVALHLGPVDELAAARAVVAVELVVTGDPRRHTAATRGADRGRELFIVPARAVRLTARGQQVRIRSPVLVLGSDLSWADVLPGQRLSAVGRLSAARDGQRVAALLSVSADGIKRGQPPLTQRAAGELRAGLRRAVAGLGPSERGLVPGLVLGDTGRMPPALTEDFRTAGLTHLTAVSGANLAIVCGFFLYIGRWSGLRGRWLPAVGGLALAGFVLLARPEPSVLRAGVMALVALAALSTGRRGGGLAALAGAMLGLLLVDPWLARSYGFALSVLATAGLLVLAPRWAQGLRRRGLPLPLAHAVAVPAAAHAACAPLVAMLSGQVSLVAIPANLLVAPAIAPATVLGVLATLVGPVSERLAEGLARLAGASAWWVVMVAERSAALPVAAISWSSSTTGALLLAAVLAAAVWLAPRASRRPRWLALALVVSVLGVAAAATTPGWPPARWVIVACNVGQGDALVLSAGDAGAVVVDAGPDPRLVDRCLRDLGVRRIAAVLITHLHADHMDGLPGVLRGRAVGEVQVGLTEVGREGELSAELRRLQVWSRKSHVPLRQVAVGERYRLGPLSWQVLWPARVITGEGSVPNNASMVVLAERDGVRMLLTGDVEEAAQRAVRARWDLGAVDVLKVAHHGSAARDPELVEVTRPRVALVSVGKGNDYGHPAASALRDLLRVGAVVGRTDEDGALAVVGPPERLRLVVRRR